MSLTITFPPYDYNDTTNVTPYVPHPDTLTCDLLPLDPKSASIMCFLLIIIFCLAIPGNLLVGWVIGARKQLLTPSDVYLVHLTVADGLMAVTVPLLAVALVKGWLFGDFMCKLVNLIIEANFYTSILFLACISIDRYLVIVRANESLAGRQRMCSWILCAAVWALGVALALPALFGDAAKLDATPQRMICSSSFNIGNASSWRLATRVFLHVFGFVIPLVVMVTCYSITIIRLLRTRGFQKHKAMKVIIAVVIAFLLCWMPYHLTVMVDTVLRTDLVPFDCKVRQLVNRAWIITHHLALVHSCINPILYAFIGEKFRRNMVLLLQRKARQERGSGSKFSRSTSQTSESYRGVL